MSDNLARMTVVEDCLNVLLASDTICEAFKEVCREHFHFAMFGSFTPPGSPVAIQLLDRFRTDWESHKTAKEEVGFRSAPLVPKTESESVLAYVLGSLSDRGASLLPKPASAEASLYQDAYLFHRYYVNNSHTPAPYRTALYEQTMENAPAAGSFEAQDVAEFFQVLHQRFFIEMHTFVPDVEDIEGWFDRLHERMEALAAERNRFAEVVTNPDPVKVREYVTDTNFYNDGDAILQLAAAIRRGSRPSQEEIDAALAAEPGSWYARALKQGCSNLLNANAFFVGGIDQSKLSEHLAG